MPGYTTPMGVAKPIADQAVNAVQGKFNDAYLKIAQTYSATKDQFEALQDFLTGLSPMELYPEYEDPEFLRYVLTTGEKPVAPSISFPEYTLPDLDTPIPPFTYSDSPYASELKDALKTKLIDGIENGGKGLGAVEEDAIYNRNQIRDEQQLQDTLDKAGEVWSTDNAGDLGLPDGALNAEKGRILKEHLAGRQTASKDIAVKMSELARQQEEVFLKTGTELENVLEKKHSDDQSRALEAAKVEPEIVIRTFEAAMTKVKVMAEIYNAIASKANALAIIFKSEMDGWSAEADVSSKELLGSVQKYDSDVKAASSKSEAYYRTDANRIEQIKNYLNLRMEGMKSLAQLNAHILAAFATSVSASASVSAQGSGSASDSTQNSSSYSETNDISE